MAIDVELGEVSVAGGMLLVVTKASPSGSETPGTGTKRRLPGVDSTFGGAAHLTGVERHPILRA